MEATAVSIGKAVLDGALRYAKSAAAEEMALQLGVERDVGFVADELEMMQSFLMTADEERDRNDKLLTAWVKQVRNVAYNVEDSLMDFAIQAEQEKPPLLGCIPRNLSDRRHIAREVKELKAKVVDMSNRNRRYRLIRDSATGSSKAAGLADAAAVMFGIDAVEENMPKVELVQLITGDAASADLRVIAVWGTSGDLGKMSEIRKAYDDQTVKAKFGWCAWVRLMRPFDTTEFLHSLVRQFYVGSAQEQEGTTVGGNVLLKMEKMGQSELVHVYGALVSSSNSYLIVIDGLSTIDEWDIVKTFFPDKKNGSRVVVASKQVEVASLCTDQPYQVSELRQLSADHVLYVFHKKVEKPVMDFAKPISKSTPLTSTGSTLGTSVLATEIEEEGERQPYEEGGGDVVATTPTVGRKLDHNNTRAARPEDIFVGRVAEKRLVIDLVGRPDSTDDCKVISVWGMGGIGKTTLIRSMYRSQELSGWKRAWATALRPFNRDALLRNLALQLQKDIQEDSSGATAGTATARELSVLLGVQNCLIVLDDLSSVEEWNSIKHILAKSRRIVITTRERIVAKHCSEDARNMYNIKGLEDDDALGLFEKKVSKDGKNIYLHPGMHEQAKLIVKKCDGLPLAISTIGGYLANKPKTLMEWRKLNGSLSAELEINPELKMIKTVLIRSYDGLPYHIKACFLYLSIFPEDHIIWRKSLVKRWVAEGYSKEMQHMTAHQVGDKYFDELLDRSMVLPSSEGGLMEKIDSCQLHDVLREICMSKAREENLVFTLEEGCNPGGTHGPIRHLSISSNWKRDKDVMQRMVADLSRLRSLTVFGEWRSFFLSDKMRFLRVLDLEHTIGLRDHHLDQMGGLLHLRYLSLRGCRCITALPSSLGNLRQLQTLDVRGTRIWMLPTTVTKLHKLQYISTSGSFLQLELEHLAGESKGTSKYDGIFGAYIKLVQKKKIYHQLQRYCCCDADLCLPCEECVGRVAQLLLVAQLGWTPHQLESRLGRSGAHVPEDGMTRHDLCNLYRYCLQCQKDKVKELLGVSVPRGLSKLTALHTLRVVSVARGSMTTTFQELRGLTHLRKLGVTGVSERNSSEFWHAIAGHDLLESLSVNLVGGSWKRRNPALLDGCLDGNLLPPQHLESLKVEGRLVRIPDWIHRLWCLSKLQLKRTMLNEAGLQALGMLPNLAVLRLRESSVEGDELTFRGSSFPSLLVLELRGFYRVSLGFEQGIMPKLEVLQVYDCREFEQISGLMFLTSLREVRVDDSSDGVQEIVRSQLADNSNNATLSVLDSASIYPPLQLGDNPKVRRRRQLLLQRARQQDLDS